MCSEAKDTRVLAGPVDVGHVMATCDGLGAGETAGQRELRELASAIGYSDGADGDDEGGVDALVDYKNALEDRLAALIDARAIPMGLPPNERRAAFGKRALDAGTPDRGDDGERTDAIDTVANVLHHLRSVGEPEPAAMLSSAAAHFYAETDGGEE